MPRVVCALLVASALVGCAAAAKTHPRPEEARVEAVGTGDALPLDETQTPADLPAPAASLLLAAPRAAPPAPAKVEGHLAHQVCVGVAARALPKQRPRKASCCYPAKELIVRPIRATYPDLRACYQARKKTEAEGRVVFAFRVEQDGSIARVCTGEGSTMDDEDAARCMVEAMRRVRYPAQTDAEVDLCGLLAFQYPVTFEP